MGRHHHMVGGVFDRCFGTDWCIIKLNEINEIEVSESVYGISEQIHPHRQFGA